ncbi:3,4-dihydroxy-2-butanone-4-phosphate synthase [Solwaraspora sp. WMMD791]|uniref:3,4-dihydroxy-2-butanone-4-phosphate synthase n=1 Tax=Solwaraspora sp. WMMD791 TaxID=3016086 RepID=UPI00249AF686|nr:3,4-dihydroxy-2-butanone-4-phosphate synthase [Solwaraspora sp. WMMD791]WFE28842.1 3,4-dihydroxy-2-butanone-4-phosphate synthase [Solwaraspora sp. WMMD791]
MTLQMLPPAAQDTLVSLLPTPERIELQEAEEAIAAIGRGELVVVVDDENRENEGDLIVAAEYADADAINFMITHGRGLVCLAITAARAAELDLPPMVERNEDHHGTAFTVSVDGTPEHGVTTGISAYERSRTVQLVLDGKASDLARPGHIFPLVARDGGVLERPGHTEASVDLARLAGLKPAGVIVEIIRPDGTMARLPDLVRFSREHNLVLTSIEKLREYSARRQGGRP